MPAVLLTEDDADAEHPFSALRAPGGGWMLSHTESDGQVGPASVMLGHELWQRRYGGDLALIGQPIDLAGGNLERRPALVGVMPPGFSFPDGANLWIPARPRPAQFNYARLSPSADIEHIQAMLPGIRVTPLREHVRPDGAFALAVLLSATGLLLLIAWVQVGALMVSNATARARELGVRLALGASRFTLAVLFLTEGGLLMVGSLMVALVLVFPLTAAVVQVLPEEMTRAQALLPDARAMVFAVVLAACGVLLLALAPIAIVRHSSPRSVLGRHIFGATGIRTTTTRTVLVACQLTITTALLYLSGLMVQSFSAVSRIDLGLTPDALVGLQMPPMLENLGRGMEDRRAELDQHSQKSRETRDAIRDVHGVIDAAYGLIPFSGEALEFNDELEVIPVGESIPIAVRLTYVSANYPRVLGLRRVSGHLPTEEEVRAGDNLALITETLARILMPSGDPVGRRLTAVGRTWTVSGVVGDFIVDHPDRPAPPRILALTDRPQAQMVVRVASGASGSHALAGVRAGFERTWPEHASREILSVATLAHVAIAEYRARVLVLIAIGMICLPLVVTGMAGALAYATAQRTPEIGLRLALGAQPRHIAWSFFRTGLQTVTIGIGMGLLGGVLLAQTISVHLFGVHAVEPLSVLGAAVVLMAAGLAGAVVPAQRAASIQPAATLKDL